MLIIERVADNTGLRSDVDIREVRPRMRTRVMFSPYQEINILEGDCTEAGIWIDIMDEHLIPDFMKKYTECE